MYEKGDPIKWDSGMGERSGRVIEQVIEDGLMIGYYVSEDNRSTQGFGRSASPTLVSPRHIVK